MKRFLLSALAFVTIMSFNACSDADLHQELNTKNELTAKSLNEKLGIEADASHQSEANEKLTKLIESFGTTKNRFQEDVPKYPDYYGGAYITQAGSLVVLLYGNQDKGKEAVGAIIGNGNVEFKLARHSYAYLLSLMDELNEFAISKKDPSLLESLTSFSLMDALNEVEVQVIGLSDQKIAALQKSGFNKPGIKFRASFGKVKPEITIYPGCAISRNSSMTGAGSVGFGAKRNSDGKLGFVTAGHAILVGETAYYSGTSVGTCVNSQQSGTVDAAFVTLNNPSTDNISNTLCGTSNLLSVSITSPGAGTVVNKIGHSTNATSGTIISTNVSILSSTGQTITNMTSATYTSAGGDSGGPVYTYISSTGTRPTAGIHMGADGPTRYFTKAGNILSTFGLSRN